MSGQRNTQSPLPRGGLPQNGRVPGAGPFSPPLASLGRLRSSPPGAESQAKRLTRGGEGRHYLLVFRSRSSTVLRSLLRIAAGLLLLPSSLLVGVPPAAWRGVPSEPWR